MGTPSSFCAENAGVTRQAAFFAPLCAATISRTPWLTILCAAPKKKQEKMSLGDFLGDQCTRNAPLAHVDG